MCSPLPPAPFDDLLLWPQGPDVRPDPLVVDWDAMACGDVRAVLAVQQAWHLAAERRTLWCLIGPYDHFEVFMGGEWVRAIHVDRYKFFAGGDVVLWAGQSWRAHQSLPSASVRARNSA
jgi:hypothetical protein